MGLKQLLFRVILSAAVLLPALAVNRGLSWIARGFLQLPCMEGVEPYRDFLYFDDGTVFPDKKNATIFQWSSFRQIIEAYLNEVGCLLSDPNRWPLDVHFGSERSILAIKEGKFLPYVMRLDLPQDAEVVFFGDLHGAFHSLLRAIWSFIDAGYIDLETLQVRPKYQKSFFMIFLGDYVDRGRHGVETVALLLTLKALNPGNVFMSRGNHEDADMNMWGANNFDGELRLKFPGITYKDLQESLFRVYNSLPLAIFIGGKRKEGVKTGGRRLNPEDDATTNGANTTPDPFDAFNEFDLGDRFEATDEATIKSQQFTPRNRGRSRRGGANPRYHAERTHVLACHGGLEVGYDPRTLLSHELDCMEPEDTSVEAQVRPKSTVAAAASVREDRESSSDGTPDSSGEAADVFGFQLGQRRAQTGATAGPLPRPTGQLIPGGQFYVDPNDNNSGRSGLGLRERLVSASCGGDALLERTPLGYFRGIACTYRPGRVLPAGAVVSFSLVRNLLRQQWLTNLPQNMKPLVASVYTNLFTNIAGYYNTFEVKGNVYNIELEDVQDEVGGVPVNGTHFMTLLSPVIPEALLTPPGVLAGLVVEEMGIQFGNKIPERRIPAYAARTRNLATFNYDEQVEETVVGIGGVEHQWSEGGYSGEVGARELRGHHSRVCEMSEEERIARIRFQYSSSLSFDFDALTRPRYHHDDSESESPKRRRIRRRKRDKKRTSKPVDGGENEGMRMRRSRKRKHSTQRRSKKHKYNHLDAEIMTDAYLLSVSKEQEEFYANTTSYRSKRGFYKMPPKGVPIYHVRLPEKSMHYREEEEVTREYSSNTPFASDKVMPPLDTLRVNLDPVEIPSEHVHPSRGAPRQLLGGMDDPPAIGFMWTDFITDDSRTPMEYTYGRGFAFGYSLTDHVLREWGVAGIFRAHQHNNAPNTGPMLTRLQKGGGAYNNWGGSSHVVTMLSGAHIPDLNVDRDAYVIVRVRGDSPREWRMELCNRLVEAQTMRDWAVSVRGDAFPILTAMGLDWQDILKDRKSSTPHICDIQHTFQCSLFPWKGIDD